MSLLGQNSTPAEILRDISFSELFRDRLDVSRNGGLITGSPVVCDGVELDGVSDKITYGLVTGVKTISFWVTLGTLTEDVIKLSSSHSVTVSAGVISANGFSSPTIYVNGFATSSITASRSFVMIKTATAFNADDFQAGFVAGFLSGKLEQLKLWKSELTEQEAKDFYTGETYNYESKAVLNLPMRACQHQPDNNRTLDVSKSGNHAVFGAGSAEPLKLPGRGYLFDGVDDYFKLLQKNTLTYADNETVYCLANISTVNFMYYYSTRDGSTGGFSAFRNSFKMNAIIGTGIQSDGNTRLSGIDSLTWVREANSIIRYYKDGKPDGINSSLSGVYTDGTSQFIGARGDGIGGTATWLTGAIYTIIRFPFALTPLQVADLHVKMMKEINNV